MFLTNFLAISCNFEQLRFFPFDGFFFRCPIFFWGGAKKFKIIFDQFSRHLRQFWTTLIFFHFWQKNVVRPPIFIFFLGGGGLKLQKLFSTNFLAIACNFEQLWFLSILTFFFGGGGRGGYPKIYFCHFHLVRPIQMNKRTKKRTNKRTNKRMNKRTNEQTNEQTNFKNCRRTECSFMYIDRLLLYNCSENKPCQDIQQINAPYFFGGSCLYISMG